MVDAIQIVQPPLEKLYNSLNPEQMQRFDAMGKPESNGPQHDTDANGNLAALCNEEQEFAKVPIDRIEQVVAPTTQQHAAFEDLRKTSQTAVDDLQASCPSQMPNTPVARLDSIKERLDAMIAAMNKIQPKLADFYGVTQRRPKSQIQHPGPGPAKCFRSFGG